MFSVIIPLFNKAHTITRTLNSVLRQSFHQFEVIVVNDGSTDNSVALVKEFVDHRIRIIEQVNQGVSVARNTGVSEAKFAYVAFLDGDDEWLPKYLEEIAFLITKFPCAGIYATKVGEVYGGKVRFPNIFTVKAGMCNLFKNFSCVNSSNAVIPRAVYEQAGGFAPGVKHTEDWELWIKIALKHEVCLSAKLLSLYHHGVEGQTTKIAAGQEIYSYVYLIQSEFEENKQNEFFVKYAKSVYRTLIVNRIGCFGKKGLTEVYESLDVKNVLPYEADLFKLFPITMFVFWKLMGLPKSIMFRCLNNWPLSKEIDRKALGNSL